MIIIIFDIPIYILINQKENLDSFLFPPFLNNFLHLKESIKFEEVYPFLFSTIIYEYVYFIIIVGLGLLIQPTGLKVLKPTCGSFFWLELMPICGNIKASCACCYYEIKIGGEGALFAFFLCHGAGWLISQFTGVFSSEKSSYFSLVLVE